MDNNEPNNDVVDNKDNIGTQANSNPDEEKTFTQEEVNSFLKKEINKKMKDMPKEDELKAFKEWKESQKTQEQKYADLSVALEKSNNSNKNYENLIEVIDSGVSKEFRKFVASEVGAMEGDFSKNLKTYLKENPKFIEGSTPIKTVNTAPKLNGSTNEQNTTNQIMNDLIRSSRN